jgi:hypothetical protein
MTAILGALTSGRTAQQILRYLSQQNPRLAQQINSAINAGHSLDHIVRYMSKHEKKIGKLIPDEKTSRSSNLYKTAQKDLHPALEGGAKALGVGLGIATAATGAGLALNAGRNAAVQASQILPALQQQGQAAQTAGSAIIPNAPPPTPSPIQPTPIPTQDAGIVPQGVAPQTPGQQIGQGIQAPITQALQPSSPTQIAQASQAIPDQMQQQPEAMMPQQAPQQLPIFEQLLGGIDPATLEPAKQQQLQFLSQISDQLQSKGKTINDPEFIKLGKKIKDIVKGKPGMMIEETARFNAGQEQKQANVKPLDIEQTEQPTSIVEPAKITKPQSIAKGESVITEDGNIAEVKGTSGNNFLIEENGKVRQVPMDSLRSQPEAIKKAKIVFDPSKVPESEKSAALAFSVPMPDRSSIINMFHDGSYYVYRRKDGKPIDESIIKRIIEGQDIPMTTGETFMGSWNQDTGDSRGSAAFKELTAMAQDATKPDDPTKPLIFEKITNSFTHGYIKEFMQLLKETGKNFSAKPKKQKK